jgi:DMSO reductase family type II enzyme heme b subunit
MSSATASAVRFGALLLLLSVLYFAGMFLLGRPRLDSVTRPAPLSPHLVGDELSLDASSGVWAVVEPVTVTLFPQTARAPYGTERRELRVRALRNRHEVAFLLEFADATENRGDTPHPDGCAVLLTPRPGPASTQMMGHGRAANIWHWTAQDLDGEVEGEPYADAGARELAASGPGTQAPFGAQNVVGRGQWQSGRWQVILRRDLEGRQPGAWNLTGGASLAVSFAVWDGAKGETLSSKSISVLRPLILSSSSDENVSGTP